MVAFFSCGSQFVKEHVIDLTRLSADWISWVTPSPSLDTFLPRVLSAYESATATPLTIYAAEQGDWHVVAHSPSAQSASIPPTPERLLAEVADVGQIQRDGSLVASRLSLGPWSVAAIVTESQPGIDLDEWAAFVDRLDQAMGIVHQRESMIRQVRRLEITMQIVQTCDEETSFPDLITELDQSARKLLDAERAVFFLWDRQNKQLTGWSCVGGQLQKSDDTGVARQAIQTGNSQRARRDATGHLSPEVRGKGNMEVRNVVCVPMRNRRDKIVGAVQVMNKQRSDFSQLDDAELTEFAAFCAWMIPHCQDRSGSPGNSSSASQDSAARPALIGQSPPMKKLRQTIDRIGDSDLPVLILGENGTGKEIVSRTIHENSRRREQPFLAVNCAAISETLLESELFGHEKGAFTDASERRIGKFEAADGGTLFLDEIGELSLSSQSKILRSLENRQVTRVGGSELVPVDVRIVAATNRDLAALVRDRAFREDLFFRMNVVTIHVPSLRERGDDVVLLADHFLAKSCAQAGRSVPELTKPAVDWLRRHEWPGNVRELQNMMQRMAYLSSESSVDVHELRQSADDTEAAGFEELPLSKATRQFQVDYIQKQIRRSAGNMTMAAERLGLHRSNLYRKMSQLGITTDEASH